MNAQKTVSQIMRERGITHQRLSEKLGCKFSTSVSERLRNKNGIRSDLLVEMLEQLDCELVVRSKLKDHREWVIDLSEEE